MADPGAGARGHAAASESDFSKWDGVGPGRALVWSSGNSALI